MQSLTMLIYEKFQSGSEQQISKKTNQNTYECNLNRSVIPEADPIIITPEKLIKYVNVNSEKENFSAEFDEYATSLKVIPLFFQLVINFILKHFQGNEITEDMVKTLQSFYKIGEIGESAKNETEKVFQISFLLNFGIKVYTIVVYSWCKCLDGFFE